MGLLVSVRCEGKEVGRGVECRAALVVFNAEPLLMGGLGVMIITSVGGNYPLAKNLGELVDWSSAREADG